MLHINPKERLTVKSAIELAESILSLETHSERVNAIAVLLIEASYDGYHQGATETKDKAIAIMMSGVKNNE